VCRKYFIKEALEGFGDLKIGGKSNLHYEICGCP
jgi:hypothetical protein